jgi:hypothetical protein
LLIQTLIALWRYNHCFVLGGQLMAAGTRKSRY